MVLEITSEGYRTGKVDLPIDGVDPLWSGPNEVTPMGLREQYLIGYDLKNGYAKNIGLDDIYSPHQIYVRSTNQNMTLMSAQAQLEAILPPGRRPLLSNEQANRAVPPTDITDDFQRDVIDALGDNIMPNQYQVAPIHAYAADKDTVLSGDFCPTIAQEQSTSTSSEDWVQSMKQKYPTLVNLWKATGNDGSIEDVNLDQVALYIDTLLQYQKN